jgi:GMP synthase (glutamine-hydrolysing)
MTSHDKILIVDFGSQVTQLIARRVREEGVYSEIVPYQKAQDAFAEMRPKGVILSGGPASVHAAGAPLPPPELYDTGVPVLGICYGEQAMAQQLGGKVEGGHHREFGRAEVEVVEDSPLFANVWKRGEKYPVWMSHGDRVTKPPPGFRVLATSPNAPIAAIGDEARKFYATQFHLEVVHTPQGAALIRNFVRRIVGASGDWTMRAFKDEAIERIRKQVGKGRVICGLSGGVDSAVAAVLIHEAIGDQLTCVFVDHGLLRLAEAEKVVALFRGSYNIPLVHVEASELFLNALQGVTDPEVKRKTIGKLFIDVFDREAAKIGGAEFLAQGTLYPDVIESVSFSGGPSVTIKSHHNVGGLPARMNMKLVEPLRCSRTRYACSAASWVCPKPSSAATRFPDRGSRSAAPARSPPTNWKSCGSPMRSTSRRSAAPDCMMRSGRPSPCCCRSRPSASWATAAPTTTSLACAPSPRPTA